MDLIERITNQARATIDYEEREHRKAATLLEASASTDSDGFPDGGGVTANLGAEDGIP